MRQLTDTKRRLLQSAGEIMLGYVAQGQSLVYLADIYDTSARSIANVLREQGVVLRDPGRPKTKDK